MSERATAQTESRETGDLQMRSPGRSGDGGGSGNDPQQGDKPPGQLDGEGSGNSPDVGKPTGLGTLLAGLGMYMRDPTDPSLPPDKTSQLGGDDDNTEAVS